MAGQLVVTLARMKLAVLRHTLRGSQLGRFKQSVLLGLTAVVVTFWVAFQDYSIPGQAGDSLAIIFAIWTLGWIIGPILFGGEDRTLLPEHFRSLPFTTPRLVKGLLGASLISVPAVVSFLAFMSVVVYAISLGAIPVVVSILAAVLQLLLAIAASRMVVNLLREYTQSQWAAVISSLVTGALAAFLVTGWFLFSTAQNILTEGLSDQVSTLLHILPTGWAVVAVEAAGKGHWLLAIGALGGLGLLIGLFYLGWARLLEKRLTNGRVQKNALAASKKSLRNSVTASGAVAYKEFITWRRDYTRGSFMYFALFYSLFVCLYPALAGVTYLLPFAGVLFVVSAVGSTANLYGADGSSLWHTLVTPRATKADVRGRQWAWLAIVAPVALLVTLVPILLTGHYWTLPVALSIVVVALGAGAGLLVVNSVFRMEPMTDPHKRGDNAYDHSISWWQFVSLLLGLVVLAAPVAGLVVWGIVSEMLWLQWMALPLAVVLGVAYFRILGNIAARKLELSGPELLQAMLHDASDEKTETPETQTKFDQVYNTLPWGPKAAMIACMIVAPVALLPQGVMPLIFKLIGEDDPVWFLALYMPEPLQWPVIAGMFLLGLGALALLRRIYETYATKQRIKPAAVNKPKS